jgi:hypothetical protein
MLRENGAEERQRFSPTATRSLCKQPRRGFDELERELDLRAKLRG